jgi:hypothetical protein
MKIITSALLLSLAAAGGYSQSPLPAAEAPGVEVVKKDWRFEVRNPALDESPFIAIEERLQEESDIRETAAENERRRKLGVRPIKKPERPPAERKDRPARAAYIYEIKVKNTGDKPISSLTLEYVFFEPGTTREVGRRQFTGKEQISPGKSKTLVFRSASPPTGSINANDAGKKDDRKYTEQVVVRSIQYSDGTNWEAAINKP